MRASRTLEVLAAMMFLVPATSVALSQDLSAPTTGTTTPTSTAVVPSPPGGNVTAVTGSRLVIVGIVAHHPDAYSDLPSQAQSFELLGHRSFSWVFVSRAGDRAGADLTVANFGAGSAVAIINCDAPSGMTFAVLETPGYGAGAVMYLGGNSYGMLLPGGASGNFTLIYASDAPGRYTGSCTLSEGS